MTNLREAAQMALDMFDWLERRSMYQDLQMKQTHEALRAALAQPEPEPVAWMFPDDLERFETSETYAEAYSLARLSVSKGETVPLYTAPPQREWQGLTDEEIREFEI